MKKIDPQEYIQKFEQHDKLGSHFKMKITEINRDECWVEYLALPEHYNPNGVLHGGSLYTVMDSAQGAFVHFILEDTFLFAATGTATIKYLAPVRSGKIRVKTWLQNKSGRKLFVLSEARNEKNEIVASLEEVWISINQVKA